MQSYSTDVDFLKDILEIQNNLLVRVDDKNRFLYISKAYAGFFDLDPVAMLGKVFIPRIHEDDLENFQKTHEILKKTKKTQNITQREMSKNGWIWIEWQIIPILDENSEIKQIQSVGKDVTELVNTQDALKHTSNLLYSVIQSSPDAILVKDFDGNYRLANKKFADYFNTAPEEVIGKNEKNFFEDETELRMLATEREEIKGSQTLTYKEESLNIGGVQKYFDVVLVPLYADNDDSGLYLKISRDVTEEKRTRVKARLLYEALEQSSAAVLVTDTDGKILHANRKFKSLYKYDDDDLLGNYPRILKSGVMDEYIYTNLWATVLDGREFNSEMINKAKDGELHWVLMSVSPIKNEFGHIEYFVAVSEDIRSQKGLENELKNAKQKLENINEELEKKVEERTSQLLFSNLMLKRQIAERKKIEAEKDHKEKLLAQQSKFASLGEMINMIAHQWRQPLTAISAAAINIKTKKALDILSTQSLDSILDDIMVQTQKMSATINDFMNFFKPSKAKEEFLLKDVIDDTLRLIGAQLQVRGIKYTFLHGFDKPVVGFKNELEQVFVNILSNTRDAFEKTEKIGKLISIECKTLEDDRIMIEFCDNAGGIDENILERVFEPYFTTKEPDKGTGIGLYMSKVILQKSFNGDMNIENIYDEEGRRTGVKCIVIISPYGG